VYQKISYILLTILSAVLFLISLVWVMSFKDYTHGTFDMILALFALTLRDTK